MINTISKFCFSFFCFFCLVKPTIVQGQKELSITRTWSQTSGKSEKTISKVYKITYDSVIINLIGDPHISRIAIKLEQRDTLYRELLSTTSEQWENIAEIGKNCINCDTCIGVKVTLKNAGLSKEYWIRCIGAGYPSNIQVFTDKIFNRIKK